MSHPRRQAISASYLSHEGNYLTFVSRFRPRQQALSLTLNAGEGDIRLEVQLKQARETRNGDFICQGEITQGAEFLSQPQVPTSVQKYARTYPRTTARLRALSPTLPGFKALSMDLSQGGLKLETQDRMIPGTRIQMSLDLDLPDQTPVPLTCRVVWCQQTGKTYVVGLQFVDLEPWISPLLETFQAWLDGTGLKPKPYTPPAELEFPEPAGSGEQEAVPAGSIANVCFGQAQVELTLSWTRGEVFHVIFQKVLVLRDNRGIEGAAFYDAVDLEDSTLMVAARKVQPVSLEIKRELYHYQFLNRSEHVIFEIVCGEPAEHILLGEES